MEESSSINCTDRTDGLKFLPETTLYVVGTQLKNDDELMHMLKEFDTELLFIADQSDVESTLSVEELLTKSCFIVECFDDIMFSVLRKKTSKIFASAAVKQFAAKHLPLPTLFRPLYCIAMTKLVICFTGFRKKEELNPLVDYVHHMGGSVRKEFSPSVTHLVANTTSGEKYRYAVSLGKPIVSSAWVLKCWENRENLAFLAKDLDLGEYKVKPFVSCCLTFVGFSAEEKRHMEDLTITNGGKLCELGDSSGTHVIVDDQNSDELSLTTANVFLVKVEWFWASIQIDARADELLYQPYSVDENGSIRLTPGSGLTPNSRARKRKRLKDTLGQLANLTDFDTCSPPLGNMKQRRSGENANSPSQLDATVSPVRDSEDGLEDVTGFTDDGGLLCLNSSIFKTPQDIKSMSPRQQVCHELLQTEINYVGILKTILTLIRDPIEDVEQVGGPLLDATEVKIIFGNVPPICEVHTKLRDDLMKLLNCWKEEHSIGETILKYSQDFLKAYPPFVNYFEKTKEMVVKCDNSLPRFHAFLKICQKKSECGRQSLVELLIRPVQRLPSIILLLNDILKHTAVSNPDREALENAIKCLKEVLTNINEDKRRTEGQVAMFGIVNDIENCPPNLLSSHRNFVTKADMIELSDGISGKGDNLTMFLFTDVLEVCKRRRNNANLGLMNAGSSVNPLSTISRSPSVVSLHSVKNQRNYKHVELVPLSHIKRVVNILETDDCHNVFALVCRSPHELKERLYSFTLITKEVEVCAQNDGNNGVKLAFLRSLCRNVANTVCRPDVETFFTSLEPHQLDIMSSDTTMNTLSKAVRFASRTSKKVGRAFSFTKTPHRLSRAVSTMISPLVGPFSPSSSPLKIATKKFPCASTNNLHLIDSPIPSISATVNIGRKPKSHTIGPSSLGKRL